MRVRICLKGVLVAVVVVVAGRDNTLLLVGTLFSYFTEPRRMGSMGRGCPRGLWDWWGRGKGGDGGMGYRH